jgi:GNAT superfamily N-acetyltransferase
VTATVRRLTAEEIDTDGFLALLGEAAGLDTDALIRIRDVELPTMTVVGTVDGSVLGFAAFGADTHGEDRTDLHYIAVAHEARGTGLGSRLVDAARRADTTRPLYASTDDDAVDFYRRLGFVVADAPRDRRWPTRQRYDCLLEPLGEPAELTLDAYRAHARRYAQRTPATPSPLVAELAARLPVGSCVLELGSGPGRDADALEAAGFAVDRTDAAASFVAMQHDAGHRARLLDVRDADFGGPYDGVFASAVLLHVARPRLGGVLSRARMATRRGGVMIASFKKGDGEHWSDAKLEVPRHFVLWREDALADAFATAGWTDVEVRDSSSPHAAEAWITVTARNGSSD